MVDSVSNEAYVLIIKKNDVDLSGSGTLINLSTSIFDTTLLAHVSPPKLYATTTKMSEEPAYLTQAQQNPDPVDEVYATQAHVFSVVFADTSSQAIVEVNFVTSFSRQLSGNTETEKKFKHGITIKARKWTTLEGSSANIAGVDKLLITQMPFGASESFYLGIKGSTVNAPAGFAVQATVGGERHFYYTQRKNSEFTTNFVKLLDFTDPNLDTTQVEMMASGLETFTAVSEEKNNGATRFEIKHDTILWNHLTKTRMHVKNTLNMLDLQEAVPTESVWF